MIKLGMCLYVLCLQQSALHTYGIDASSVLDSPIDEQGSPHKHVWNPNCKYLSSLFIVYHYIIDIACN
jgi:hypothetical protein